MSEPNLLSTAGLIYDIAGAIMLVQAILRTSDEQLARQAHPGGQFSGGNLKLFGALEEQRHDARSGLVLLVVGFSLQLAAALGYALPSGWLSGAISIAPLVAYGIWWRVQRGRFARSRRDRYADLHDTPLDRANFLRNNSPERH